jgi:hypothetical protein
MRHNLIKTNNYLLVVDDSQVTQHDYVTCPETKELSMSKPTDTQLRYFNKDVWKKVIAHLPLNGAPYLDGVDVLPPLEDDVEQLAKLKYPIIMSPNGRNLAGGHYDIDVNFSERSAYEHGYKKAREKYKYTEEDMLQAAKYGYEFRDTTSFPEHNFEDSCINNTKQWLKSRQQPKYPVAFECDVEPKFKHIGSSKEVKGSGSRIKNKYAGNPKTIINSEGRTEWVGKYIYN